MSWKMECPGDLIMKNSNFARIATSHRASSLEQAGLQIARKRAEQRQQGFIFDASSAHVQARNDSFLSPAHDSIGSRQWTTPQKTLQRPQHMCRQDFLAATPPRHQITSVVRDRTPPSPPPLLHVSVRCPAPRDSCTDLKFAGNSLGENREKYFRGRIERNDETLFAKVQSFRKVLNKVYPPPPLVKKSSVKDPSRDPPVSPFGDVRKQVIERAPHASLSKLPSKGHTSVQMPAGNIGRVCRSTNSSKTPSEQLMTDLANTVSVFCRPKAPPLSSSLKTCTPTKRRCSSVSTSSAATCSPKRCLSVPPTSTTHTANKQMKISASPPRSNLSATRDHRSVASMETPPPLKHNGSSVLQPTPSSRRLETNDSESCGGFAYDHDSMPKIIAVHSVTWKESEAESPQSKGFPLVQYQSVNTTMRRERGSSEDRFNRSCFDAHLNTTVADSRQRSPVSIQSQAEAEDKRFIELSRNENVTNDHNPTRQASERTQSIGKSAQHWKHSRNNGCQLVRLAPASPHLSNVAEARREFGDLASFCSRDLLSRYSHARAEQASKMHEYRNLSVPRGHLLNMTSQNYAHASIALNSRQPHKVSCPESIQMFSTHQQASLTSTSTTVKQTVNGRLSFGKSGQLKFALEGNPNCNAAMSTCKTKILPSPCEMQNKNEQGGMIIKQNLLNPDSAVSLHEPTSNQQTVGIEDNKEAASTTDKLEELCRKILETRERFDNEDIKWKKKILRSLEIVLIKRLRKVERETGQKAEITVPEELITTHGKQKERQQERQETKTAKQRKRS